VCVKIFPAPTSGSLCPRQEGAAEIDLHSPKSIGLETCGDGNGCE